MNKLLVLFGVLAVALASRQHYGRYHYGAHQQTAPRHSARQQQFERHAGYRFPPHLMATDGKAAQLKPMKAHKKAAPSVAGANLGGNMAGQQGEAGQGEGAQGEAGQGEGAQGYGGGGGDDGGDEVRGESHAESQGAEATQEDGYGMTPAGDYDHFHGDDFDDHFIAIIVAAGVLILIGLFAAVFLNWRFSAVTIDYICRRECDPVHSGRGCDSHNRYGSGMLAGARYPHSGKDKKRLYKEGYGLSHCDTRGNIIKNYGPNNCRSRCDSKAHCSMI